MGDTVQDNMLRCNPSQIQLTSNDLERHTLNRRRALSDVAKGKARLSTGPCLPTIIAAASEDGIFAQRSSTATVYPPSHHKRDSAKHLQYDIPAREASAFALYPKEQSNCTSTVLHPECIPIDCQTSTRDDEPVKIDSPQASPSSDAYLSVPPLVIGTEGRIRDLHPQTSHFSHYSEAGIYSASASRDVARQRSPSTTDHAPSTHAGRRVFRELPGSDGPSTSTHLRRMSATRTRRSKSRSHERVLQFHEEFPEHTAPISSSRRTRPQRYNPSAMFNARDLDPGAPVFTPRVRFGSTTVVPERSDDVDTSDLRLRSPSEQNSNINHTRHSQESAPNSATRPRRPGSNAVIARSRQSSENNASPLPNLERYPLLLPTARNDLDRESRAPVYSGPHQPPAQSVRMPSKGPESSSSSPQETPASRIPSIISAASGISNLSISDDAAAEFLRFRPSPLDGLTAELGRLSAALGPVTIASEKCVNLLNGNPFDVSGTLTYDEDIDLESSEVDLDAVRRDTAHPKLLASPSHFTLPCSQAVPNTPVPLPGSSRVQASPSKATIETKTPSRQAAANTSATPKFPIYNDATPAHLQPQTPADLHRSSRRSRNRSDSSVHREAFCVGQVLLAPRPPIPERKAYRNTYPANVIVGGDSLHAGTNRSAGMRRGDRDRDETENGAQGLMSELESDRAVWVRRRQGRSLDVTPPGQGRFERFLD